MNTPQSEGLPVRWWLLTLHGVAAILFGLAAVFWPGLTLGMLVYIFSLYILVAGLISLVDALISIGRGQAWILTMVLGIAQLGVGLYLVRNPLVSFGIFILLIGFSFVVSGLVEAIVALTERAVDASSTSRTLHFISAALSILVGIFVLMQPASAGVTFVWVLGLFALIHGPIAIAMSMDVKRLEDQVNQA